MLFINWIISYFRRTFEGTPPATTQHVYQAYAECNSEYSEEEAEEVTTTNNGPNEDCRQSSATWNAVKTGFSNTRADHGEQSESGDDTDRYCDAEESVSNDGSAGGGCIEEEEDSAMLGESCI